MTILNLSLVQFDIQWKDPKSNYSKIRSLLKEVTSTDLIVLPELFATGFCVDDIRLAEDIDGQTVAFMQDLANEKSGVVLGTVMISDNNNIYNRMLAVNSSGVIAQYNKMHLFSPSDEAENFVSGTDIVDIAVKNAKCRLSVCYDLRFPYMSYNNSGYHILINSANWPAQRIAHWDALLKARAIENQAYVVGVNRVGVDPDSHQYPGHSSVYNANGEQLIRFTGEEVQQLSLDLKELKEFRKTLPFIQDQKS
jgi:predicted amidohydrolase